MERTAGIAPASSAWKAEVLLLDDVRKRAEPRLRPEPLLDAQDDASSDGLAALTDCEPHPGLHPDRLLELEGHLAWSPG